MKDTVLRTSKFWIEASCSKLFEGFQPQLFSIFNQTNYYVSSFKYAAMKFLFVLTQLSATAMHD